MKRDTNHHSIVISKFHWAETTNFICLCAPDGIRALVARSGGLWICVTGYRWGSLSIIPPGFAFDSKRLLLLPCTCPLERIHFLWAVQLLICFLLARFWDCSVSNHRLVFLWQNKHKKPFECQIVRRVSHPSWKQHLLQSHHMKEVGSSWASIIREYNCFYLLREILSY